MDAISFRTVSANAKTVTKNWVIVDANDQVLGRLTSRIAIILRGKHKTNYTPHVDCGDHVIVINADKVRFTGKKWAQKEYHDYSLHPGGLKVVTAEEMLAKHPERIIERAIKGMLPKTKLGKAMAKKMFVYTGTEHPHQAQKPEVISFK